MSGNPYSSPQHTSYPMRKDQPPSPIALVLGIVSIVTGVLTFIPGCCCCGIFAMPGAFVSIGTGVGGLMTADANDQGARVTSMVGIAIGTVVLLIYVVLFVMSLLGHAVNPQQFQQNFGN